MKIASTVCRKIKESSELSLRLASVLGVKQVAVEQLATRKSNKLCHYGCVLIYKEFGLTEKEIFEN
ncbi:MULTISPECIES: hypothetical protein [Elizabethkingia]|uniref:XRE family transcriptional regulator n=1 Tax=Elizabethkingia miricola TaxID=172045 RepID=A0ABD4DQQ8_ELIMR|nr:MULTISPECIES: hypothetical protein [Elizabethkingia]MCT3689528.1 hypothetical protein [Elizabethkingia anophelis]KUY20855.1 hypothetical protein ATB95_08135 [Elizabethkingia miricola]KUY28070.1 hypothetical protein ATB96_19740 [Elizabethkingia ursingii]MCL1652932.1 hypothetical protein [Elizabethkingia miricola]MCL1671759.1 hypothetical protein [Elizabethkingia ursingii]